MTDDGSSWAYEHSASFNTLKGIKERISGNFTSAQYLETLDLLIMSALTPIIHSTTLADSFVCQMLGWQESNRKRKVSMLDRAEFTQIALAWLLLPSNVDKANAFPRMRIERGALLEFLSTLHSWFDSYLNACDGLQADAEGNLLPIEEQIAYQREVETSLGAAFSLRPNILASRHWFEHAVSFKRAILEKYVRLCITTAQRHYVEVFKKKIRLDDLVQAYLMAAIRGIDKCDARQGVLTTHVNYWLLTEKGKFVAHMKENDLFVPENEGLLGNETYTPAHDGEQPQVIEEVRALARILDPEGYGRAYLGISESSFYLEQAQELML